MKYLLLFLYTLIFSAVVYAQEPDKFSGRWYFEKTDAATNTFYQMELLVAAPERQTLYPAQLTVKYEQFTGRYNLLLVKKNNYQLAIGRQKIVVKEEPFGIGAYTIPLNGTFDLHGNTLEVNRIKANRYGFAVPSLSVYEENNKMAVIRVSEFLRNEPISLKKTSSDPWRNIAAGKMLYTYGSTDYYGLSDTFYTRNANGIIGLSEYEKNDDNDDTISVMLNKKMIIDRADINEPFSKEIKLDTGLNILCFFADNYGSKAPNTAKLSLNFEGKKFLLDFTTKENMSATFIVAKIYLLRENQQPPGVETTAKDDIKRRVESRQTKWIDSIKATSQEVTLAFWDDAVEDGDSISLQINDEIFMTGLAVKKKPKFVKVKLYPGENKIIFIADNLGSIPPNTSMLEIIDGKKRKAYMINTDMGANSAIKITYDLHL